MAGIPSRPPGHVSRGAIHGPGTYRGVSARQSLTLATARRRHIALYCGSSKLRLRITRLLSNARIRTAESRETFSDVFKECHRLGIVGLEEWSRADAAWLRHSVGRSPRKQSCIVVAQISLLNLQSLRALGRDFFRVVWDEEADDRLAAVLDEINGEREWRTDPLQSLGQRLLACGKLRPSLRTVIAHICDRSGGASPPPRRSAELARIIHLAPATLCRYWKADVPLRCGPKALLSWAMLLWAVERRSEAKWDTVAKNMGVRRRTLERCCSNLAACTLAEAAREPGMVRERFEAWVKAVSEMDLSAGSTFVATRPRIDVAAPVPPRTGG